MVENDYPELSQFFVGTFNQDWTLDHETPDEAIDSALAVAPRTWLIPVREQWTDLLGRIEDDVALRRVLQRCLRANVAMPKPKEARAFADLMNRKLETALRESRQ